MQIILITLFVAAAVTTALYLGAILPFLLPQVSPLFDRKPFNCRPCITFHLTWLLIGIEAYLLGSMSLFVVGVVLAFVVFAIINYSENKKIEK